MSNMCCRRILDGRPSLRWLRARTQDLNAMWADCEDVLMPPAPVGRVSLSTLWLQLRL